MTQCKESDSYHDAATAVAAAGPASERSTPTDYDGFLLSLQYDRLTAQQHSVSPSRWKWVKIEPISVVISRPLCHIQTPVTNGKCA